MPVLMESPGILDTPDADGESPPAPARPPLTFRTPDEILAMPFDDDDIILGDRMMATGQAIVIAGAGGLGKSRMMLQLAASQIAGRNFLKFQTHNSHLRWLVFQTENTNRRLQADLQRLRFWLDKDWAKFNRQFLIHTLENDDDGFVSLESLDNIGAVQKAIIDHAADVVVFDPLNDFAIGDPNKDSDMKTTVTTLSRLARKGNPNRAPVVLHHAMTGKSGAAKATGYDRTSFARNSKVLFAWTRAQINLAPVDPETNERLIVSCAKCSNGREFEAFGVKLDPTTMTYEVDESVDVDAWAAEMAGAKAPLMTPERVAELCRVPMEKGDLAKVIREDCGCTRESAYRYTKRAEQARLLKFNAATGHYTKR